MFPEKHFIYKTNKEPEEALSELEEKIKTDGQFNFRKTAKELGPKVYITEKVHVFYPNRHVSLSQIEGEVKNTEVIFKITAGIFPEAVVFVTGALLIFFAIGYADTQEWYISALLIFPLILIYLALRLQVSSEIRYLERKLKELIDLD